MDLSAKIASEIVVYSKYAKYNSDLQRRETWDELVARYEAMMVKKYPTMVDDIKEACEAVRRKEILPSMRGLQFAGTPIERNNSRIYNCAFMQASYPGFFRETMFLLLGGTGVGYSVQSRHISRLPKIQKPAKEKRFNVGDSIEGWSDAIDVLFRAYFKGKYLPRFDFSDVRQKGMRLITAGGKAPGPGPLRICLDKIRGLLETKEVGSQLTSVEVSDLACFIADAVLSGGIRRAAMICLFDISDEYMLAYKKGPWWDLRPERARVNVSAMAFRDYVSEQIDPTDPPGLDSWHEVIASPTTEEDFKKFWKATEESRSGEPGIYWSNHPDWGTNPCCFGANTLLETPEGQKPIADLAGDLLLVNSYGQAVKGKVWSNGLKPVVEVKLATKKKITCTPDHVFMLNDGSSCQAKDLQHKRVMPFYKMNREVSEFTKYGFIQGDGGTGRLATTTHLGIEVHIGKDDGDIAQLFGIIPVPDKRIYYLAGFKDNLNSLGFSSEELPKRELPKSYWAWDTKDKQHFLCGLFSANGSVINTARVSLKTTCKQLVLQLTGALAEFGIASFVTTNKPKQVRFSNGTYLCKQSYDLNISQIDSIKKFCEKISFVHEYKRKALGNLIISRGDFVQSVKEKGTEEVFDFSLCGNNHWGIVEGLIAHNCEIALKHKQFCNLTTINFATCKTQDDLNRRAQLAARLGTLQAGFTDMHYLGKDWEENCKYEALLGVSLTGIGDNADYEKFDFKKAADLAYYENKRVAEDIGINSAFRLTCIKPEGTASLVLGCASGVHGRHSPFYIRRFRFKRIETIAQYLSQKIPDLVVEDKFDPDGVILELPQRSPSGSIPRNEGALETLKRLKFFRQTWVEPGHMFGKNTHNVSCTVSVKDDEWQDVGNWMWENREFYNGIAVLPFDGGSYAQAPFESCDEETFDKMFEKLNDINLTEVNENEDNTAVAEVLACAGGACSIE